MIPIKKVISKLNHFIFKKLHLYLYQMQISVEISRTSFKTFILTISNYNPGTFSFYIFPLILYFGFLKDNKLQNIKELTKLNVPGIHSNYENMSWETIQKTNFFYLPYSPTNFRQMKNLSKTMLEKSLFQNSINLIKSYHDFITFELKESWKNHKKQFFLGTLKQKTPKNHLLIFQARENFTSNYYQMVHGNHRKFYELDEFALKLEGSKQNHSIACLKIDNHDSLIHQDLKNQEKKSPFFIKFEQSEKKIVGLAFRKKMKNHSLKNQSHPSIFQIIQNNLQTNIKFENQIFQNYQNWKKIQSQINLLFYQKNYIPDMDQNIDFKLLKNLIKRQNRGIASHQFLLFLEDFEKNSSAPKFQKEFRLMSGFQHPDWNREMSFNFLKTKNYFDLLKFAQKQDSSSFKVWFISGFNFSSSYFPITKKPMPLKMLYQSIRYKIDHDRHFYRGPALRYDSKKRRYAATNFYQVLENLTKQLSFNHPNNQNFSSFFGNDQFYYLKNSPENSSYHSQLKEINQNQPILKSFKPNSSEKDFSIDVHGYENKFEVCYIKDWKKWFRENKTPALDNTTLINSLPIRQINTFKKNPLNFYFDFAEYETEKEFFKKFKNQNIYFYEPEFLQSSMTSDDLRNSLFQYSFNKKSSYYDRPAKNGDQFFQAESWEPFHQNSWLFLTQYLFAFFIFYTLKQFLQEYGRELFAYLIDLFASLGVVDETFKDDFAATTESTSAYQIIKNPKKTFHDIAGIEKFFMEISEVVWFLRTSGQSPTLKVGKMLPKGILLVGLPGTGKTLLVKAIAGEARVPILQPTGALNTLDGLGPHRLQNLFEKAKQLAPCIIFFDEIDSIGQKRSNILQNPKTSSSQEFFQKKVNLTSGLPFTKTRIQKNQEIKEEEEKEQKLSQSSETLNLLMQLLIELDGLQTRKRVVVIGATNRPECLDPALIRPGRLGKVFKLDFPGKNERIEICKLYGKTLGLDPSISWSSIGNQTVGLSGADLAAIMNQSSIQGILNDSCHTMLTIEYGIDQLIHSNFDNSSKEYLWNVVANQKNPFSLASLAYYQSGRTIIETTTMETNIPPFLFICSFLPKIKNTRYAKLTNEVDLRFVTREQCENKVTSLLAGKAAERLFLLNSNHGLKKSTLNAWDSDLGSDDLKRASSFIYLMIDKCHLYSGTLLFPRVFNFSQNLNYLEIFDENLLDFFENSLNETDNPVESMEKQRSKYRHYESWSIRPWWQLRVMNENQEFDASAANWYRIYMYDPEESDRNEEWMPPDQYYHENEAHFITRTIPFDDFWRNERDFIYQCILHQCFETAFYMLNGNREFLDFFVQSLLQQKLLREDDIEKMGEFFAEE